MSYYTNETEACFILYGMPLQGVSGVYILDNQKLKKLDLNRVKSDCGTFCVDIQSKTPGIHSLKVTISLQWGKNLDLNAEYVILPARSNEVKIDRITGGLYVDGLPFYPFGFYTGSPVGDVPVQEVYNAMNLVGVYQSNTEETLQQRRDYMDLCASVGMKVNYAVNGLIGTPHDKTDYLISKSEEERRENLLKKEIETFKDHPALLSWYMNDEPVGQGRSPDLLKKAYQTIKKIDPYHPVTVVFVIPERAKAFENSMDIAMTDPYPIPGDISEVQGHMQSLQKHFRYRKATWLVPQAFGGGEFWSREPTGKEMRIMSYLGIYEGAMGIKYFIRRPPNFFPKSRLAWNEATKIAHEVSMLYPWLFDEGGMTKLITRTDNILAGIWEVGDQKLLMVLNKSNKPTKFSIDLTQINVKKEDAIQVLFENRNVEFQQTFLEDFIDGYDVKFYQFDIGNEETSQMSKHNLFINPGFEKWISPGVPMGCYAASDNQPHFDGSTYFVDAQNPHSGNYALRVNSASDSSHLALSFYKMLVEKDQLYSCSFWTSSPNQPGTVPLKVSIPQLNLEQIFESGPKWQKHQFDFEVDTNFSFIQVIVETAGKGTFWIDDIVASPDPMIDVVINDDGLATVNLELLNPDKSLSYTINGGKSIRYSRPFQVKEYTELEIYVNDKKNIQRVTLHTIPISKATLKPCSFDTPYSPKYAGNLDRTLVDGSFASLSFRDGKWLGFEGRDVQFEIDLLKEQPISEVICNFLVSTKDGIHAPISMDIEIGDSDQNFQYFGSVKSEGSKYAPSYLQKETVRGEAEGRYVRFNIKSPINIPAGYLFAGTKAWIFIDEVMIL